MPLVIRWPELTAAGGVCQEAVSSIDLYPTIAEMVGLNSGVVKEQDVDGLTLVPLLQEPLAELPRETLHWHYPHYYPTTSPVSSIRQGDWKLLEYFEDGHVELYNLADDPSEQNDLADQLPEKAAEIREELINWRDSVGAQLPKVNPTVER